MDKTFLTLKNVAHQLGVSEKTIYRMLNDNQLPFAVKIGGQWRFRADAMEAWINGQISAEPGRKQIHSGIGVSEALAAGAVLYRLQGENRDEVLDELLSMVPSSEAFDPQLLKVSLFSRESLVPSSLKGIACLEPGPDKPVYAETTMLLLGFLERPMDFRALDRELAGAILLVLGANAAEQAIVAMKLRRLLMEPEVVSWLRTQPGRREIVQQFGEMERRLFSRSCP